MTRRAEANLKVSVMTKRAAGRDELPVEWLRENNLPLLFERGAYKIVYVVKQELLRMMKRKFVQWQRVVAEQQGIELDRWLKNRAAFKVQIRFWFDFHYCILFLVFI